MNTMNLESKVMEQLKQAMKSKDEVALRTLRSIKAALLEAKTAANAKDEISEADELKILQKMAKQRKDSLTIFTEQNRTDLALKEQEELDVLSHFLPQPLTDEELTEKIKDIIATLGATSPADMGKVMGMASKTLGGQADGGSIASKVKALLSNS